MQRRFSFESRRFFEHFRFRLQKKYEFGMITMISYRQEIS